MTFLRPTRACSDAQGDTTSAAVAAPIEKTDSSTSDVERAQPNRTARSTSDATQPPLSSSLEAEAAEYDNARAWPTWKKVVNVAVLANMTLALTFSSSAFVSSSAHLIEHFGIAREVVLLGVSLFVVGFASGPLLLGPMAQMVGHRPVYVVTYLCFTAFSFGVSEAPNVAALLVFRFLAGAFGSSSLNNVPASIGDMVEPGQGNGLMMCYALSAFGGPGLGPLLGAFVDTRVGWRWNMRMQAIHVAVATVALVLLQSESSHVILRRRAQDRRAKAAEAIDKSRAAPPPPPSSSSSSSPSKGKMLRTALYGPFLWLFTEPVVMFVCVYLSLLYAVLYMTFVVLPLAFMGKRHFSPESNGLIYLSLVVGFLFGATAFMLLQSRFVRRATAAALATTGERLAPESRLRQALWASALPPIGLLLFGWTAPFADVHWIAPCIGMSIFTMGMLICFTSFIPYLVDYGGPQAPLLLAAATTTRSLFGAAFPLFATQMFTALTIQGGCSMLAGVMLVMMPLPLLLTRYGPAWRAMSRRRAAATV